LLRLAVGGGSPRSCSAKIVTQARLTDSDQGMLSHMTSTRARLTATLLTLISISVQVLVAGFHNHREHRPLDQRAMTAGLCASADRAPCAPAPHQHDSDGCLLCWATAIAATSVTPVAPQLPVPPTLVALKLGTFDSRPPAFTHRTCFQARGPPKVISG
jgi:hypothetical protein